MSYKYYKSGDGDLSYYRVIYDDGYYHLRKMTKRKALTANEYNEYLGKSKSMDGINSLIKSRSQVTWIEEC